MIRRYTLAQKVEKWQDEVDRIQVILEEQERYDSLKAHGTSGAETSFVDVAQLYRRLEQLENKIQYALLRAGK